MVNPRGMLLTYRRGYVFKIFQKNFNLDRFTYRVYGLFPVGIRQFNCDWFKCFLFFFFETLDLDGKIFFDSRVFKIEFVIRHLFSCPFRSICRTDLSYVRIVFCHKIHSKFHNPKFTEIILEAPPFVK